MPLSGIQDLDWQREAVSADPSYYQWSQWFFKKLMEMGLAYRKKAAVDFCPHCNTTLAREQVWGDDRHCERCGTPVIKKNLEQWFFKTTDYAEELLDFSEIDWPERVQTMQTNWIGKSTGADVTFHTGSGEPIEIFGPDDLWRRHREEDTVESPGARAVNLSSISPRGRSLSMPM